MKKALQVIGLIVFFYALTAAISGAGFALASAVAPVLRAFDPGNTWSVITVHHLFQGLVAFALVFAYSWRTKVPLTEFGFSRNGFARAMPAVGLFCLIWLVIQFVFGYLHIYVFKLPYSLPYKIGAFNFTTYFLFEVLLSGTSEEILFRSMVTLVIMHLLRNESRTYRLAVAVGVSTVAFMLGHVNFAFDPFRVTHFNAYQQLTCLACALFYCWLIEKYKTVYAAMAAHNLVNGVITAAGLVLFVTYPLLGK